MNDPMLPPPQLIWSRLLEGDPGSAVAFFDSLLAADLAFAAGGFLRDLAERIADVDEFVEDETERLRFINAVKEAITHCLDGDVHAIEELMSEAQIKEG